MWNRCQVASVDSATAATATDAATTSIGPAYGRRAACHMPSSVALHVLCRVARSASRATSGTTRSVSTAPVRTLSSSVTGSNPSITAPCRTWYHPTAVSRASATSIPARCTPDCRLGRVTAACSST